MRLNRTLGGAPFYYGGALYHLNEVLLSMQPDPIVHSSCQMDSAFLGTSLTGS